LALVANGVIETINWSFCDSNLVEFFTQKNDQLILSNPISAELDHLRPTLLIGLIQSYQKNYLRNFINLSFFEIGNVFLNPPQGDRFLPSRTKESYSAQLAAGKFINSQNGQKMMISGIRAGKNVEQNHYRDERNFDIFDVKKDFFDVIKTFGLNQESLQVKASSDNEIPKYYHPHRFAEVKLGKNIIGYFGEIHPKITKKFALNINLNAFEIFVDNLPQSSKSNIKRPLIINDLPIVQRDFAFLIDKNQPIGELIKTINNCDKLLINSVEIFDIYSGKNIDEEKKSVALRVFIQPSEKTFSAEEIEVLSNKIIDVVSQKHAAMLRQV
jgi:phenylalanyl-tRNA synthetase beta chain